MVTPSWGGGCWTLQLLSTLSASAELYTLDISIHTQYHSHSLIDWISNKLCLTSEPLKVCSLVHSFILFIRSLVFTYSNMAQLAYLL